MPKVKIRHALITWTEEKNGRLVTETAFRGMTVNVPEGPQLDKLKKFGAVIPPDLELDRPGKMLELREGPSDQELINWVIGATETEVNVLLLERPSMAPRIANIQEVVKEKYDEQNRLLGQPVEAAGQVDPPDIGESDMLNPGAVVVTPPPEGGDDGRIEPDLGVVTDLDHVVRGSVGDVTEFLSNNPEQAAGILDAESRRATEKRQQPRPGILTAVQAAVSHTAS